MATNYESMRDMLGDGRAKAWRLFKSTKSRTLDTYGVVYGVEWHVKWTKVKVRDEINGGWTWCPTETVIEIEG